MKPAVIEEAIPFRITRCLSASRSHRLREHLQICGAITTGRNFEDFGVKCAPKKIEPAARRQSAGKKIALNPHGNESVICLSSFREIGTLEALHTEGPKIQAGLETEAAHHFRESLCGNVGVHAIARVDQAEQD